LLALAIAAMVIVRQAPTALHEFGLCSGLPPLAPGWVLRLVLVCNGFGDQTGWRGFARQRLQRRFGPLRGTLALALK
jgi:uncharacterized protein